MENELRMATRTFMPHCKMIKIEERKRKEQTMQRNLIDANKENNKAKNGTIYENSKIKGTNKKKYKNGI